VPPEADPACGVAGRTLFVAIDPAIPRQGATLRITPKRDNQPAGELTLPPRCVSHWTISGPATFNGDHTAIAIAEDAPPESEIVIGFRLGSLPAERRLRVVARDAIVLTGMHGQSSAGPCSEVSPVRELEFGPESFSVAVGPFENYRDYWGTYTYDAATGALELRVTGGNNIPPNLDLAGTAHIVGGQLIIEGIYFGDLTGRPAPAACRYVF